jgi:uncharacterized protein DUF3435
VSLNTLPVRFCSCEASIGSIRGGETRVPRKSQRAFDGAFLKCGSPIFTYTERNDNLGLCVIQDILEFAFLDDIFDSEHIKHPRDIWLYSDVPQHRLSVPIHIKECKKNIPIFRPAVQDPEGNWATHPTMALSYAQAAEDEKRACKSAGLKDLGSLYKYRKGAASQIDGKFSPSLIHIGSQN